MAKFYKVNPKVLVGVPTLEERPISWEWEDHWMGLSYPLGTSVARVRKSGKMVADARNEIAEQAIMIGADYLMFISDDVLAPSRTFEMLIRHKKHMVTGVYWTKYQPTHPYLWNGFMDGPYDDWKFGEFFEIKWAGCDCLLVHTDVLKKMEPPWFSHNWTYNEGYAPANLATEDLYFYTKAKKAGFKLYCDTAVQCDHQDRNTGIRYGLTEDMPQFVGREKWKGISGKKKIADVGCGMDTPYFGKNVQITRIDGDPKVNPDILCDIRAIPQEKEIYDIVHARHVLEHFPIDEAHKLVKEWARILKLNGELIIEVPNIYHAAREILKSENDPNYDIKYAYWQLYGRNQTNENHEYHKCGYGKRGLERVLKRVECLGNFDIQYTGINDINITAKAKKIKSSDAYPIIKNWDTSGLSNVSVDTKGKIIKPKEKKVKV